MDHKDTTNWLLRSLIVFSVGVHAVLFMHLSGIYETRAMTYIEMSLQSIAKPSIRDIPRPRPRPKIPEISDPAKTVHVIPKPMPQFKPLVMAPAENSFSNALMESIAVPEVPRAPGVDATDWVPDPRILESEGEFTTASEYLDMVKLRIESRKKYPETAKTRSVEGRVKVRFILTTDGKVRDVVVSKGSRSSALNTAAMEAVKQAAPFPRPPPNLFKKNLSLELIIVFELT